MGNNHRNEHDSDTSNEQTQPAQQPQEPTTSGEMSLALIEEQADRSIRRMLRDGQWYFSIIDVVGVLTDAPTPRMYWADMKRRIQNEGFRELLAFCQQLKMPSADGKNYRTDAADTETLLRIIQSIPSPKAEPIKQWLAKVGAQKLQEITQSTQSTIPQPAASVAQEIATLRQQKPSDDATLLEWADYHATLSALYRQQAFFQRQVDDVQAYLSYVESRLDDQSKQLSGHDDQIGELHSRMESLEEGQRLLPELLERLGPQTLTQAHQAQIKHWVGQLQEMTGWHYKRIYGDLNASFQVGTFSSIREEQWEHVARWFQVRLDAARKRRDQQN